METNPQAPSRRRRRPTLACEPCRRKKIRCNRNAPCEHCTRSKNESCIYLHSEDHIAEGLDNDRAVRRAEPPTTTVGSATNDKATGPQESSGAVASLARQGQGSWATRDLHLPYFAFPSPRSYSSQDHRHGTGSGINSDVDQSANLDHDSPNRPKSPETAPALSSSAYDGRSAIRGVFSKTRFFGQSHWMNSVYQFRNIYEEVIRNFELEGTPNHRAVYENCKSLAKAIKTQQIVNQPLRVDFRDHVPPKRVADSLVQAYLRTFESVFRILHVPSFLREYDSYWVNPSSSCVEFIIKLLLVMAIGMSFSPDRKEPASRSMPSQWISTAQSWVSSPFEKGRINILGVQIHCLLLLARQSNSIGGDLIWISAGSLLRTAMHVGLHIDPSRLAGMSFFDQEIRRRLWATVLEIIVQSSMDVGGLPLISMKDIDCELPLNIDDEQMDEGDKTTTAPAPKPRESYTRTSVQIALMRAFSVRLDIARSLNDFRSEPLYSKSLQMASSLSSICRENCLLFQSFRDDQSNCNTFQVKLLELLTHRFLLALHHPFAMKSKADPTLYYSRKVSLEVSLCLLSEPSLADDGQPRGDDFLHLGISGTGIFRDVAVQAASAICGELLNQIEEEKTSFTPVSASFSRRDLRKILEEYVDLLALRIKHNETNVRGHLLFSCLLAYTDALQADLSVEKAIANALGNSLNNSYHILKTRADESGVNSQLDTEANIAGGDRLEDVIGAGGTQDWFGMDEMEPEMDFDMWLSSNAMPMGGSYFG